MNDLFAEARKLVEAEDAVVVATVVQSPRGPGGRMLLFPDGGTRGSLGDDELVRDVVGDGLQQLRQGVSATRAYERPDGETLVFFDVYPAPDRLLVFGGVHIAVPLVELAKLMSFRVVVVDARGQFATPDRFPRADEIILAYADDYLRDARVDNSTYVVVLTHDPKLDDPALLHVLRLDPRYVGAIGSRRTHAKRVERLREAGLDDGQIARIHAPIGLDIGARNPEEIALAIMAEVVAAKNAAPNPAPVSSVEIAVGG